MTSRFDSPYEDEDSSTSSQFTLQFASSGYQSSGIIGSGRLPLTMSSNSLESLAQPPVQYWEYATNLAVNENSPVSGQTREDCDRLSHLLRHQRRFYTSIENHALRRATWSFKSILGRFVSSVCFSCGEAWLSAVGIASNSEWM